MVPEITHPKSFTKALNYNENKVQKGKAELLHAQNFIRLPEELNFYEKRERFESLMELSEAKTKVIHISLNFHPSEKERMTKDFMVQLADEYMEKLGFCDQPYLVYRHHDAAHPHVHVLSTLIRSDGTRIETHNLGRNASQQARKEIEQKYGLVKADKKELQQAIEAEKHRMLDARKLQYGKSETRRGITNVLDTVIDHYKYTSLPELNAVLRQYNVLADRGAEGGRVYQHRGLHYRMLDEDGQKVGVPIKASSIYSKPTLDRLEEKMEANKLHREQDKRHLKTAIDWVMQSGPETLSELATLLAKERMALVVRRNEQGRVYGLTYIDHERKSVFNGGDLGKEYAAKGMLERMGRDVFQEKLPVQKQQEKSTSFDKPSKEVTRESNNALGKELGRIVEHVISPEYTDTRDVDRALTEEERRRRRKRLEQDRDLER